MTGEIAAEIALTEEEATEAKAYVDAQGNYLGHFDIENAPKDGVAATVNPTNGDGKWDGRAWVYPPPAPLISSTAFLDRVGADGPALMTSPFAFALVRLAAATTIKLDDPDVVAGMQAAVDAKAITQERATELLAAP